MRLDRELNVANRLELGAGTVLRRHEVGLLKPGYKARREFVSVAELESVALNQAGLADMLAILPVARIAYKLAQVAAGIGHGNRRMR